ncbi:MAG: hypothetical protein GTO18_19700 [Anaerolineales bacterium]|nr:hypothetical protein [Anaerolineales bacterium]
MMRSTTRQRRWILILLFIPSLILGWIFVIPLFRNVDENFVVPPTESENNNNFTVMTINVGNSDPRCLPYTLKLCRKDVEERITENIMSIHPDVVALQETLPNSTCEAVPPTDAENVCAIESEKTQIRRLLGSEYTIVCETRNHYECIAVRSDVGEIVGCGLGELCETDRIDEKLEGCRLTTTVMAATVLVKERVFDIVNAHPENRSTVCREYSLRQIFEGEGGAGDLIQEADVLILGDLNLDAWREDNVSTRYWNQHVGSIGTREYYYHSGIAENDPPYFTFQYPFFRRTYDHIISNFLDGTTVVLGESPGTSRMDGGRGMDHAAVYGQLSFPNGR